MPKTLGWFKAGILVAMCVALLVGCRALPNPGHPDFDIPVQWTGNDMSILLRADGTAALEGVPGGEWEWVGDQICWEATDETFTGEATWSVYSERGVELVFGDSDVIIWADPGRFGSWSWSELKMMTCGEHPRALSLAVSCGRAGYVEAEPCRAEEQ
ncbi:hypothetical protein M2152_000222 [Microbacteriaceae bacterium SG_E_30_P1]|uniref:Uncharacterized protein n=1 Tax=Antiquaquibacter oligotrophicus TaxID=2880260 RepID=A0ABT6KK25_9MICO|nr:hypothetical protein [Antiquaquibacter oligotrophicus]MDH6180040.1 hypothetical protein [Antiquaquibacter oligotrophicus]UDF14206.1 hypothetical protein LH407_04925 [Antiquaquibacter oligotrophicus]